MRNLLTKSKFANGQVCPKRLWMFIHKGDQAAQPSEYNNWLSDQGEQVEKLAQGLFPNGVLVDRAKLDWKDCVEKTRKLIDEKVETIYQAAFYFDDVLIYCDILHLQSDGKYQLYEVKSFADFEKKVKPGDPGNFYIADIILQHYVLTKNDLDVSCSSILYLNNEYIRAESLQIESLFTSYKLSPTDLELLNEMPHLINNQKKILDKSSEYLRDMGSYCNKPNTCAFKGYCLNLLPEDSLRKTNIFHFITRDKLMSMGQNNLSNLDFSNNKVNEKLSSIRAELENKVIIDREKLNEYLKKIKFPLYFLDFECAIYPIPRYIGYKPYDKVTFQFSLHKLEELNADLKHHEFFWSKDSDPSESCVDNLCKLIGESGSIAMYSGYEKSVLDCLIQRFPSKKASLQSIIDRLINLEDPFKIKNQICCLPGSRGYSSIKKILPLISPEDNYNEMNVQSGNDAIAVYWQFINTEDKVKKETLKNSLLKYCELDTLAMVKIYRFLVKQANLLDQK